MRIDFHPAATEELEKSADWYRERSESACQRFLLAIDEAIKKIAANPQRFIRIDTRHRSCSVTAFPYQVIFRHNGGRTRIIAVAHAKRRPGYWKHRS